MKNKKKVSFPHLGNYWVAIEFLVKNALDADYIIPPPITKKTLELGSMHSPEFVCSPFKYNLGNYIEALEEGANTLMQTGGLCRLGYYGELHEQILKDLGYDFIFINLAKVSYRKPYTFFSDFKKVNPRLSISKLTNYMALMIRMVKIIDKVEGFIRENVGFEVVSGSFDKLQKEFLEALRKVKTKKEMNDVYQNYYKQFKIIKTKKPKKPLRVGIIGEYYTIMEPFSNHYIEKELAKKGMVITRTMNISNSLFLRKDKDIKTRIKGYLQYDIGATGTDTVSEALRLAKDGYDGLIHVKSFGCMPEADAMSVLQNISNDYKIPILYLSFDTQTSETGIKTRLEAFYDMIEMRKEKM